MDAKIPVLVLAAALSPALANDTDTKPAPRAPASQADDRTLAQLHEQMKLMRDTVARLQETTHPDERQELLDAHERELRHGLKLMLEHERAMEDGFR